MSDPLNHLLALLPRADRARLTASTEQVDLVIGDVLCEAGDETRHAWFPCNGFVSLLSTGRHRAPLEVGMIGREGMLGAQLALGITTAPLRAVVQGGGTAWRIDARRFRRELAAAAALRRVMDRYLYVLMLKSASAAACQRFHPVAARLAMWLLMSQDRAGTSTFQMTQAFLAFMLGVRRVGVTAAAGDLQAQGVIAYRRGELTVLNRKGLEAAACECYADDRLAHATWLAPR